MLVEGGGPVDWRAASTVSCPSAQQWALVRWCWDKACTALTVLALSSVLVCCLLAGQCDSCDSCDSECEKQDSKKSDRGQVILTSCNQSVTWEREFTVHRYHNKL